MESAGEAGTAILIYIVLKWIEWRVITRPQIEFYNDKEKKT